MFDFPALPDYDEGQPTALGPQRPELLGEARRRSTTIGQAKIQL
jgi:hypothetical protein